jgi:hypothetical protein
MKPSQRAIVLLEAALDVVDNEQHLGDLVDHLAVIALRQSAKLIGDARDLLRLVDREPS